MSHWQSRGHAAAVGWLIAMTAACGFIDGGGGDGPPGDNYDGDITIHRNIDAYGDFVLFASNDPAMASDRTIFTDGNSPNENLFWTLDAKVIADGVREMSLSVDFEPFGGCYFAGETNTFQGQFDSGSCVFPTDEGHVYFRLTEPALYQTANTFGVGTTVFEGRWMEERSGGHSTGRGVLYVRQHDQNSAIGANDTTLGAPRVADYRDPFQQAGACVTAGIAGTGVLVAGDDSTCSGPALEWGGGAFDLYIDEGARLSFVPLDQNQPDERVQGVVAPDGTLTGFTGSLSGLHSLYELDFAGGSVRFENSFLFEPSNGAPTQCTVVWEGPLTDCP